MRWWSRSVRIPILAAVVLARCSAPEPEPVIDEPVEWSVATALDKRTAQVGEDLTLTLSVTHPVGESFIAPHSEALKPFELIERREEETSPTQSSVVYRIAAYRLPQQLVIPGLEVQYREGDELVSLTTTPLDVEIVTSLTPDVTTIHDIKGQVGLDSPTPWSALWWLLLALSAALLAYAIYRRFAREPEEVPQPVAPPTPADVEALKALATLRERRLLEAGETKRYYDLLAEIMKRYAGRIFEIAYLERTTHEILADLRPHRVPELQALRELLQLADLVKFAKHVPPVERGHALFEASREMIERTRPREADTGGRDSTELSA